MYSSFFMVTVMHTTHQLETGGLVLSCKDGESEDEKMDTRKK